MKHVGRQKWIDSTLRHLPDVFECLRYRKKEESFYYLPGMPDWVIRYLWAKERGKQKEGIVLKQASWE